MASPVGDIRDRIDRKTREFRSKAEAVRERIRAVEAAGASNLGRLKNAVDEGIKELGQAVDKAVRTVPEDRVRGQLNNGGRTRQ